MKTAGKLLIYWLTALALATSAYAQSPREELQQMVERLQKTSNDTALREQIIKLAQELKPAPVIPTEAKRAFVMGGTYQKEAKSLEDFGLAVKAFQDAVAAAPWWGDAYYNLSVALESAKHYDEAKDALTLYLLTQPQDAEQAEERLYAMDAKMNLARVAAKAAEERSKKSIEGYWFIETLDWPIIQVVRANETLVVKPGADWITIVEAQITETNLRMKYIFSGTFLAIFELREGVLVGTLTNLSMNKTGPVTRLIHKPWPR
jgi:tetratricopeptide (TPR) repeat protein